MGQDRISNAASGMIWRIANALGILAAALGLSAGFTWYALRHPDTVTSGPWRTSLDAGGPNAGLYTRASIAVTGLFALNRDEAIYFSAAETSEGEALLRRCAYVIAGPVPSAGWWSVTAYAADDFLIPNAAGRFSFNMSELTPGSDGTFQIVASPGPRTGAWLPTGGGTGGFTLLLRLYNPAPEIVAHPETARLPAIRRDGPCT